MDPNETNFRLALLSIEEVRLTTERVAQVVHDNHKAVSEALSQQVTAINSLASTMAAALEGFRIYTSSQEQLIDKVAQLELDVAELKRRAS